MSMLAELKRRNVVRVGIAYSIIGWVLAQVLEFAFQTFSAPDWALKSVVVVLLLGLPVALFFAWAYEITPSGLKREKDVDRSESITSHTGRRLDKAIVAGLILVSILIVTQAWLPGIVDSSTPNRELEHSGSSVAVLPFADLSPQGDQAYFSDGISEEILNVLVRIPGLKVAGRTSSFSYKNQNADIPSIGAALGVSHILEGSVRRAGDTVRITAQLVRSNDGFHMWSETYDRAIADIFAIQDEIARSVADQLAVSLGLAQREQITSSRTDNLTAYENMLKARQLHVARGAENLDEALLLLQEAVALDPDFAPAWAEIAGIYTNYYAYQDAASRERSMLQWRIIGTAAAERAIELNPSDGHAHAHLGAFLAMDNKWVAAFDSYRRAVDLAPDSPAVADSYAQNLIESGYLRSALEHSQRATSLDPLAAIYRNTVARSYSGLGKPLEAIEQLQKAIALDPTLIFPFNNLFTLLYETGRHDEALDLAEFAVANGYDPILLEIIKATAEAWGNETEMRALIGKYGGIVDRGIAKAINDQELLLELFLEIWQRENLVERGLFIVVEDYVYDSPVWKQQIRRYGLLDLWRANGFPAHCYEIDGNDFECKVSLLSDQ